MTELSSERLKLRKINSDDAGFLQKLYNDPAFIKNIGDRGLHSEEKTKDYINNVLVQSYEDNGFGLYLTELTDGTPIGICGLVNRPTLDDIDIGFAFLPEFWGKGYAYESAKAVYEFGKNDLEIEKIVAITDPGNIGSIKVLEKIGLKFEKTIVLEGDNKELNFYS